ncbi:MAG: DUF134 domain-containing protein [Candidatus Buchananbacteria bacterium]|nr:DUF134 domain-containing protein [Candidatus Buchananbacteria bacterium]
MPRPKLQRKIGFDPNVTYFKPRGVPMRTLQEVALTIEEVEAIRLKDFLGLEQTQAAEKMKTSQSTFQRILTQAHQKIAQAIIEGKALKINQNKI